MKQYVMLFEEFQNNLKEASTKSLRVKFVITDDYKYAGVVDYVKGNTLNIEINSEGDTVSYDVKNVYVIDMPEDEMYDILATKPMPDFDIDGAEPAAMKKYLDKYFKGNIVDAKSLKESIASFEYLEECLNEGTTPIFKRLLKRAKEEGVATISELDDLISDEFDDAEPHISGADYEIAKKKLKLTESSDNSSYDELDEAKKIVYKRKYTDNYPAKEVGLHGRVRDKVLKAMSDKEMTQEEFDNIVQEFNLSKRWVRNNSNLFKVKGGMVALSETGRRIWKAKSPEVNENDNIKEGKYTSPDYFLQELISLANDNYVNSNIDILRNKQPDSYEDAYELVLTHVHKTDIEAFNNDVDKLTDTLKIEFKI
jgi:hypothetical protein